MTFDTHTIVLVVQRLIRLRERPALFNEKMPPSRVLERYGRVLIWLGTSGRIVVWEHIRDRRTPSPGARKWARGGYRFPVEAE